MPFRRRILLAGASTPGGPVYPYGLPGLIHCNDLHLSTPTLGTGADAGQVVELSDASGNGRPLFRYSGVVAGPTLITDPDGGPALSFMDNQVLGVAFPLRAGFTQFLLYRAFVDYQMHNPLYFTCPADGARPWYYFDGAQWKTFNGSGGYGNYGNCYLGWQLLVYGGDDAGTNGRTYQTGTGFRPQENPFNTIAGLTLAPPVFVRSLVTYDRLLSEAEILSVRDQMAVNFGLTL